MTCPTRNECYQALHVLAKGLSWQREDGSVSTIAHFSRRLKLFGDLPEWPAHCQGEHGESSRQTTNMPYIMTYKASWWIHFDAGKDKTATPAIEANNILDAVYAVIGPGCFDPNGLGERQTLGGLVHHAFIDGEIFKDPGDIDGQGLIIVPITMLVP